MGCIKELMKGENATNIEKKELADLVKRYTNLFQISPVTNAKIGRTKSEACGE